MRRYFLVAGIDFGTSFTKVVVRDNNAPGSKATVVPFPQFPNGLLPSLVGIQEERLTLSAFPEKAANIPYLKMLVAHVAQHNTLCNSPSKVPKRLIPLYHKRKNTRQLLRDMLSYYLAYVIAATKAFIRTQSNWKDFDFTPQNPNDTLLFQLAVPTGLLNDDGKTEKLFRQSFIAGHALSQDVNPSGVEAMPYTTWARKVDSVIPPNSTDWEAGYEWQCLIYPEVAAAVQTIFRAPNAQDGLYITMDVGAGTVDLNAFRRFTVPNSGQRNLDYYAAIVRPLGVQNLVDTHIIVNPLTEAQLMAALRQTIQELYHSACLYQPNCGAIPGRRTWDHTRLFIFGGGSHRQEYQKNFQAGIANAGIHNSRFYFLPQATDIKLPPNIDFGRFAVAYGLSFFRANLDTVHLPHQLERFANSYPQNRQRPVRQNQFNWED